jgi:hypothetical protein
MTKANQLRQKLVASNNRMPYAQAVAIMGSRSNMGNMIKTGEISLEGEGDDREVVLDPGFRSSRQLPIKRKRKARRKTARRATGKPRSLKAIAERLATTPPLRNLALDNLFATADHLIGTLQREVEGLDKNPNLAAAMQLHCNAVQIARAA